MSALMVARVWRAYPAGGDDLILALALADQATDDGTVFIDDPTFLMEKCRLTPDRYATLWLHMHLKGLLVSKDDKDDRGDEYKLVIPE